VLLWIASSGHSRPKDGVASLAYGPPRNDGTFSAELTRTKTRARLCAAGCITNHATQSIVGIEAKHAMRNASRAKPRARTFLLRTESTADDFKRRRRNAHFSKTVVKSGQQWSGVVSAAENAALIFQKQWSKVVNGGPKWSSP
jgi:hypothetical protein